MIFRWNSANLPPAIRRLDVPAPPEWANRRILHLTDLHLTPNSGEAERIVRGLTGVSCDILVITGDILEHAEALPELKKVLDAIACSGPRFAVLGNHDLVGDRHYVPNELHPAIEFMKVQAVRVLSRFFGRIKEARPVRRDDEAEQIRSAVESVGVRVLHNESMPVADFKDAWIVGVADPYSGHDDVPGALQELPTSTRPLALIHAPGPAPELIAAGAFLVLSGHTHGNQVYLPGMDRLFGFGGKDWRPRYGIFEQPGGVVVVSGGAGHLVPLRVNVPPEAWLIDLVPMTARTTKQSIAVATR